MARSPLKKAEEEAWKWFSRYIRLRDTDSSGYGKCITCGAVKYWKDADCGHGIPRQHKATKFNERNNHLQCKKCNGFEGGKRESYKEAVDRMYGAGTWDKLELASRMTYKASLFEYKLTAKVYQQKAQELAIEKGIAL